MSLNYRLLPDNSVLSLIAPTASGKTDLACRLYETGRFELISVDSALIYRDMDIGTAKPTADELALYPHHLVNIISPADSYSVANFVGDVKWLIDDIHARGKIPLLVGGTMMYFMALFDGLSAVPDTDPKIREQVAEWIAQKGMNDLYAYLQSHDPNICQKLKPSDSQRISRAVEVHLQTGTPMSVWQNTPKTALAHNPAQKWLALSVMPDRAWLHQRIALRLDMMWQAGFIDEVISLLAKYELTPDIPSMRCVGYRQVLEFLAITGHDCMQTSPVWHKFSTDWQKNPPDFAYLSKNLAKIRRNATDMACQDMKNKALYATRQLAKRQSTWQRQLAGLEGLPTITADTSQDAFLQHQSPVIALFDTIKEVEQHLLLV
jgi:tRNA dimethylallyltransferase